MRPGFAGVVALAVVGVGAPTVLAATGEAPVAAPLLALAAVAAGLVAFRAGRERLARGCLGGAFFGSFVETASTLMHEGDFSILGALLAGVFYAVAMAVIEHWTPRGDKRRAA